MCHDKCHFFVAAFVCTIYITCTDHGVEGDCERSDEYIEPQNCTGIEISTRSVWTGIQCLDECIRLPHCDKFIFNRTEKENCKLLSTDGIPSAPGVRNLRNISGACSPTSMNIVKDFLLGTKYCPYPLSWKSNDPSLGSSSSMN